ncbi:MAG: hypothetical protein WDA71_13580, partial [Actinomycetota bacterium]
PGRGPGVSRDGAAPSAGSDVPNEVLGELRGTVHTHRFNDAVALMAEALSAVGEERYEGALEAGRRAKALAPRSASVRELMGVVLYRLGRWREAQAELGAYARMSGRHDEDHLLADCARALGRPERAVELVKLLDAKTIDEEVWSEALIVGAGAYADMNQAEAGLALLHHGSLHPGELEPHHLRLWYALGDLSERCGRKAEAAQAFAAIVARDPEFFDAVARLEALEGTRTGR